jgi:outer membrane receptor protein involved in Fe transport
MATNSERAASLDARRLGGFHRYATTVAALALLGAPFRAMAQTSAAASTLNEVVVTAQKRSERVQDVPLSITAYSGNALIERGVTDISKLGYETPGVSERNSGPGQTEYEMRGIASSGGQSPTVGFYLDETPLTPPADAQNGKVVIDPSL